MNKLTKALAAQGKGLDHKMQAKITKDIALSVEECREEVLNCWNQLDF